MQERAHFISLLFLMVEVCCPLLPYVVYPMKRTFRPYKELGSILFIECWSVYRLWGQYKYFGETIIYGTRYS
ncbi:hypothetical protein BJ742DRAFT_832973 [Cladochytrium replicatum]|nr:hypothetical protein BJ742DRAFT_832973 [Cladochytrium replicatum]